MSEVFTKEFSGIQSFPKVIKHKAVRNYRDIGFRKTTLAKNSNKARKAAYKRKFGHSKLISIPKLLEKADNIFSKWIRERDEYECFAQFIPNEGEKCKGAIQNCHLIKRSYKPTRFDETNCNAGCQHHNYNHDHGFQARPEVYTAWYIKVYGALPYQDLVDKSRLFHKWTREELESIIKKYGKISPRTG